MAELVIGVLKRKEVGAEKIGGGREKKSGATARPRGKWVVMERA
jgi:hypothetical protein